MHEQNNSKTNRNKTQKNHKNLIQNNISAKKHTKVQKILIFAKLFFINLQKNWLLRLS